MVQLETERLILREFKKDDLPHFNRMNADAMVMEFLPRVLDEQSSEKLFKRFQSHFNKHGFGLFAVEEKESSQFAGFVGLNTVDFKADFTPAIEIAWRLDYGFWGKGFATEAAAEVVRYAFEDLKLEEIVSFTVHDNTASIHVMEKIGMKEVPNGQFNYPKLPDGHPLGCFVLYKMAAKDYMP